MKTIKFLSVLVLVAVVGIATAVERPQMNVIRLDNEKALIAIANEKPAHFELSIESENGDLVYYKESETEITNLRQVINYTALENRPNNPRCCSPCHRLENQRNSQAHASPHRGGAAPRGGER